MPRSPPSAPKIAVPAWRFRPSWPIRQPSTMQASPTATGARHSAKPPGAMNHRIRPRRRCRPHRPCHHRGGPAADPAAAGGGQPPRRRRQHCRAAGRRPRRGWPYPADGRRQREHQHSRLPAASLRPEDQFLRGAAADAPAHVHPGQGRWPPARHGRCHRRGDGEAPGSQPRLLRDRLDLSLGLRGAGEARRGGVPARALYRRRARPPGDRRRPGRPDGRQPGGIQSEGRQCRTADAPQRPPGRRCQSPAGATSATTWDWPSRAAR